ncbi:MAG: hypothetical protein QOE15_1932, partial [Acidimicrobiaceae bacterium]|nr:hypothetical protein [Acidimicrobiaceae bacterium]
VATMLLVHAARKECRQQVVLLDPVIKCVDHPIERIAPAGPFIQRRICNHSSKNIRWVRPESALIGLGVMR